MPYRRSVAPAVEPVSIEEAKAHLRVDGADDNSLISALIMAAREHCEDLQGRAYCTQTWRLLADRIDGRTLLLPRPPLRSVTSIKFTGADGSVTTVPSTDYLVDTTSEPGRVVLVDGADWPAIDLVAAGAVEVIFVAGYGVAADVPQSIKQAMLLLIGHWYEHRSDVAGGVSMIQVPRAVDALLSLNRFVAV